MRYISHSIVKTFVMILPLLVLSCARNGKYRLVWSDEFNGAALDTTQWRIITGTGSQYGKEGYGNGELEYYTNRPNNIRVNDGNLVITAEKGAYKRKEYTSARIRTRNKFSWKYGMFVARIKLPSGQGMWPAFWMLPVSNKTGLGSRLSGMPEIDIMEMIGRMPATDYGTAHWWTDGAHMKGGHYTMKKGALSDQYHTYAVKWGPRSIRWYFDNNQYYEVTRDSLKPDSWPFNKKFTLILNLAVGGKWPGDPDSTTHFPQYMYVDYVRVYQKN